MNRREAVTGLFAVSGAVVTLPFWLAGCKGTPKVHITPNSPEAQALLGAIVDTIIPQTEGGKEPGARTAGADKYLTKLIDDTLQPAERAKVYAQLQALEDECEVAFAVSFANADKMEREAVLLKFAGSPDKSDRDFFDMLKRETIKAATSLQPVTQSIKHLRSLKS